MDCWFSEVGLIWFPWPPQVDPERCNEIIQLIALRKTTQPLPPPSCADACMEGNAYRSFFSCSPHPSKKKNHHKARITNTAKTPTNASSFLAAVRRGGNSRRRDEGKELLPASDKMLVCKIQIPFPIPESDIVITLSNMKSYIAFY